MSNLLQTSVVLTLYHDSIVIKSELCNATPKSLNLIVGYEIDKHPDSPAFHTVRVTSLSFDIIPFLTPDFFKQVEHVLQHYVTSFGYKLYPDSFSWDL